MNEGFISVSRLIKDSWNSFKANWKFLIATLLIYLAILYLLPLLLVLVGISGKSLVLDIIIQIISIAISILFATGWVKIYIKLADGEKPEYEDLYKYRRLAVLYFFNNLVSGLFFAGIAILAVALTILPTIAIIAATKVSSVIIIPVIIILVLLLYPLFFINSLVPFITVDKRLYPIATIKRAFAITKGKRTKLSLISVVLFLFSISGLILLIFGVLITFAIGAIAYAKLYRTLESK